MVPAGISAVLLILFKLPLLFLESPSGSEVFVVRLRSCVRVFEWYERFRQSSERAAWMRFCVLRV